MKEPMANWTIFPREAHLQRPVRDLWTNRRLSGSFKMPPHGAIAFKRT